MLEEGLSTRWILKNNISNNKGQLAIFVALVFQVLFVLFAMAINVALIVHDKINLQNSVDLAAYYAASKQAEMLNAIAHQNYQIRQSWKLLAWRYRVLGTMGLLQGATGRHPAFPGTPQNTLRDIEWAGASVSDRRFYPSICVNYKPTWTSADPDQNACKDMDLTVVEIPTIPKMASFNPINLVINTFSNALRKDFNASCGNVGLWNWWFMKAIKESYRQDQMNRRQVIEALALAASRPAENWTDIDGQSVNQGVLQTLTKNLTWSNSQQAPEMRVYNSLSAYSGNANWLKPIMISPHFQYTDVKGATGCTAEKKGYQTPVNQSRAPNVRAFIFSSLKGSLLMSRPPYPVPDHVPERLVVGYEKNPWMQAYVAVEAKTYSRQIFHPFGGNPVKITAKAYAKPFGGRIGPWYGQDWGPADEQSSGDKVDVRGPPRTQAGGKLDSYIDPDRFPNYSRYPGDELGLASRLAQASLKNIFNAFAGKINHYFGVYQPIQLGEYNDPLAWDVRTNKAPNPRKFEIAAIVPDLFDITYYSIDANYWTNYGERIAANRGALGIPDDVYVRPDLGSRSKVPSLEKYSVYDQIATTMSNDVYIPKAYFYVKDYQHLLTSWVPGPFANNYPAPTGDPNIPFGQCTQPDFTKGNDPKPEAPPHPGACIKGGRVGYSVKLVSEKYLKGNDFSIGKGGSKGAIKNPPTF